MNKLAESRKAHLDGAREDIRNRVPRNSPEAMVWGHQYHYKNYFLKKRKRTAVMDANCPIQNMNIHLMISVLTCSILISNFLKSSFVAISLSKEELFVSKADSTAEAIAFDLGSSKTGRSASKIFNVFAYAIKTSYAEIVTNNYRLCQALQAPYFSRGKVKNE